MFKKTILFLSLILPFCLKAQLGVGSWDVFPTFQKVDQLIETPSKVYCLSAGTLMSYDKQSDETYTYGINNLLTEARPSNIYYNQLGKYLAVTYPSGNIDLIYDNGKAVNLPDIRDAILNVVPQINDIAFAKDRMAVATNFGLVIYDDKKHEVRQSGIYETNVYSVGISDDLIIMYNNKDSKIRFARNGDRINLLSNFKELEASLLGAVQHMVALDGNTFLTQAILAKGVGPKKFSYDYETNTITVDKAGQNGYVGMYPAKNGYYFYGDQSIALCDANGDVTYYSYPADFKGQVLAMWDDPTVIWAGDSKGFGCYSVDNDNITVLNDKIKGETLSVTKVGNITTSKSGKIYFSNRGYNSSHDGDWPSGKLPTYINVIENGKVRDITPYKEDGTPIIISSYNIIEDPDDPDIIYVPSYYDGVYKIKNGEILTTYNNTNSKIVPLSGNRMAIYSIDMDDAGNLYAGQWHYTYNTRGAIHILPAAARKKDTTTADDWSIVDLGVEDKQDALVRYCKKSNTLVMSWFWSMGLWFIDPADTSKRVFLESFYDQDNKQVSLYACEEIGCLFEDSKGRLWVGYSQGVFIIPNPADFRNSNFRVQRIKVPRNDGTNFADYLLDSENVLCIAEDSQGCKWIGTQNSGVYLVSENGTEIIEHFTADNSMLTTNTVYAVGCDPNSNAVYFGTTDGLLRYNSTAAPASDDYSNVYAYPNPVRPEYSGWITVTGLMDNSLVKIADAAGNVFFQGRSQGGMITWDGCDRSGNRVATGVYYVFASQGDENGSSGAVTKILVVK